jgi:hypothetical protein
LILAVSLVDTLFNILEKLYFLLPVFWWWLQILLFYAFKRLERADHVRTKEFHQPVLMGLEN